FLGVTLRADVGAFDRKAAVMADQAAAEAVIDQPGIADRAGKAMAARAAKRQRRIAAPVEKQQRLLAALDRVADRFGETRRDIAAGRRTFATKINRVDVRQVLAAKARRQRDALVAPASRVDLAFQRRRRR